MAFFTIHIIYSKGAVVSNRKGILMADQKIDNLLNLAMAATPEERRKSEDLNVGYDQASRMWDIIVKYSGSASPSVLENLL